MKKKKPTHISIGHSSKLVGWEIRYHFFFNFPVVKVVDHPTSSSRLHPEFVAKISYLNFLGISNGLHVFVADPASLSRLHPLMI